MPKSQTPTVASKYTLYHMLQLNYPNTMQCNTKICNAHNDLVGRLAESEVRAVSGGKWQVKKQQQNNMF